MPTGVYPRTAKHSFNKGKKHPNRKRYSKGITQIHRECAFCDKPFVTDSRQPKKKYCTQSCRSKDHRDVNIKNLEKIDRKHQAEVISARVGELHQNWKGGVSRGYKTGYYSKEYKNWRTSVFERDDFTCKDCGQEGGYLTAHHIKSFAHYPELRFDLENGLTLCEPCHSKTDNYKGRNKGKGKLKPI